MCGTLNSRRVKEPSNLSNLLKDLVADLQFHCYSITCHYANEPHFRLAGHTEDRGN
jgi:hypothetical protein